MKITNLFPWIASLVILSCSARAQLNLRFGGGGNVVIPSADYGGSVVDFYNGNKYGLAAGVGIHLKSRVDLLGVPLAGSMEYSILRNNGADGSGGHIELEQRIFSLKLGPEFHLEFQDSALTAYVGFDIALYNIGGDVTFRDVSTVPANAYIMRATERLGAGLNGGVLIALYPAATLDIGLSYNVLNAVGKRWENAQVNQDERLNSYLSINDERDPLYAPGNSAHFIGASRAIHVVELTISVLFRM